MFGAYKSKYIKLVQLAMDTIITQFLKTNYQFVSFDNVNLFSWTVVIYNIYISLYTISAKLNKSNVNHVIKAKIHKN